MITWDEYEKEAGDADFIINILPSTLDTKRILDDKKIRQMKKGSHFMNVGRGDTVEEEALYNALKDENHLGGACLDVWWNYNWAGEHKEPFYPSKMPYHELPNVTLSPHRTHTLSDLQVSEFWAQVTPNINAIEKGLTLQNHIDYNRGY